MTAQTPFIQIKSVSRVFNGGNGVHDLSIDIPRGSFVVLLGPSGCGKSTTLRLIAGLETADQGMIAIDGKDVTNVPPSKRGLSMVFQSYALFPHLSVAENIIFGLKVRKTSKDEIKTRLTEALNVTGLQGYEERKPAELSGGQRQRVALARAIVAGHPLCLMDEPLSNLDAKLRHSVRKDIRDLQQRLGITVVYVTHDQTEAMSMADIVILMKDGRIEQAGHPADLYLKPATAFAAGFVGSPPMALMPASALPREVVPAGLDVSRLTFGIRPEDLALTTDTTTKAWGITATVNGSEFLGAETFISVAIPGTEGATARLPGRVHIAPGTQVSLSWAGAAAHWFDGEDGRRLAPTTSRQSAREPNTSIETDTAIPSL
ncbi:MULTISPECIES: ABC transporter ATP-binding protein [Thalassospira]|uniref:ABC transporter ATP-binding protein n=2 Tax=Thalassospira TaxID=168934 RepID=A0A367WBK0_9PROT|nr:MULTISPECIES: ABC transporter ATP-binding protein [Thalassospira]MDG4718204.1 ABC transporter ATP-binding protein [Thalassospira sp. FZY0004]RCK37961.1 ABC transporter ATP-binding protein [Thalassospira profundimaris]